MIRVLFVCLGNICRSPMAEAIFRHMAKENQLQDQIHVASAGTGGWHSGEKPHKGTCGILKARGISFEGIRARQITTGDFERFDYIVAMDESNVADLRALSSKPVYLLSHFVPSASWKSVPDPWYTHNFEETYTLLEEGCRHLLVSITARTKGDSTDGRP